MSGIASKGQLRMSFLRWAIVTVPLILLLGFASGRAVPAGSENNWYVALQKPELTPPGWVFPVAWTSLYILLGLAVALILHARGARGRGLALAVFAVQFALNLAWTPLFFGAHRIGAAIEPQPAPTSQSNSPGIGANVDRVTARISRLVSCPSCK